MSPTPHVNGLWAQAIASELARGGLDHAAVSPGARSGPLALALHRHPRITISVHPDERSGAFFALGRARGTGHVVATLTTSGTAVVNQHPAVVEAHHALVPLLVVSADRPPRLRDAGANQTIRQAGVFQAHANWSHDPGPPRADAASLRYVRAVVGRALAHARGPPAGPVHLNLPFDEPLTADARGPPAGEPSGGGPRGGYLPWLAATAPHRWPDPLVMDTLVRRFAGARGVIVAGPRHRDDTLAASVLSLARRLDVPVVADPLSGVRYQRAMDERILSTADAFLSVPAVRSALRPDWVLQFGATPTSKHVLLWLEELTGAMRVSVDESGRHPDAVATAAVSVHADADRFALMLDRRLSRTPARATARATGDAPGAPGGDGPGAWTRRFIDLERAARRALAGEGDWEATLPRRALESLPPRGLLFVGSSLPVRDLDRYGFPSPGPRRVLANRGASGIDGTVASAAGAAAVHGGECVAVVGDVAFAHDVGSLALLRRHAPGLRLVVVDNGGGAIFGLLPFGERDPPFSELFLTPTALDAARAAQAYGLPHRVVGETEDLVAPLRELPGGVVEVKVDRERSLRRRAETARRLAAVLEPTVR